MKPGVRLFVFGLGYTGGAFARAMVGDADWIAGTVRSVEKAVALAAEGVRAFMFDGSAAGIGVAEAIHHATHLVVSIPPRVADPVLAWHAQNVIAAANLRWIGYLSTVGVYGDHGGAWVGEEKSPQPARGRSTERLEAERAWQAVAAERGVPLAIMRIAGIYGPGRNALVNVAAGRARRIVKPGQVFNRIHLDDILQVLAAVIDREAAGILNLADDEPAPAEEVVAYAARLMGVPVPPDTLFDAVELAPMARSFYGENKRISNKRIKQELGVVLRYPTYREGLTALWRDGTWRQDPVMSVA